MNKGDESSANVEDLSFSVTTLEIDNDQIKFAVNFDNTAAVSIGSKQDILIVELTDSDFFASSITGSKIEAGHTSFMNLPKMYSSIEFQ